MKRERANWINILLVLALAWTAPAQNAFALMHAAPAPDSGSHAMHAGTAGHGSCCPDQAAEKGVSMANSHDDGGCEDGSCVKGCTTCGHCTAAFTSGFSSEYPATYSFVRAVANSPRDIFYDAELRPPLPLHS